MVHPDLLQLDQIAERLESLIKGEQDSLDAYLTSIEMHATVSETKAICHAHFVAFDGNGVPRVRALARLLAHRLIDYIIPASEVQEAHQYFVKHRSAAKLVELQIKAKSLLVKAKNTGEGGELLLYLLVQFYLGFPQLLCKMSLKTSGNVHYHGTDGLHVGVDPSGKLALYWGESKMYATFSDAVIACFDSIKPFLCDTGGSTTAEHRDLELIREQIDLSDPSLEDAFVEYLDPDSPHFNSVAHRGVCLVAFDDSKYPTKPNEKDAKALLNEFKDVVAEWRTAVGKHLKNRTPLDAIELHVFLLPVPSVQTFRDFFLLEVAGV